MTFGMVRSAVNRYNKGLFAVHAFIIYLISAVQIQDVYYYVHIYSLYNLYHSDSILYFLALSSS